MNLYPLPAAELKGEGMTSQRARDRLASSLKEEGIRDLRVVDERLFDVALAVGRAGLPQVLGVGAQDVRLPPVQIGLHDQCVEAVLLDLGAPQQPDRVDDVGSAPLVPAGDDDVRALLPEPHRDGAADVARRPGHQGALPIQS